MFRIPFRVLIALALLPALALPGCRRAETEAAKKAAAPAEQEATDTKLLVVYTYDAFPKELQKKITDHFSASFQVEAKVQRFEDTGGLFNQLFLERADPRADLAIGLDNTFLSRIIQEDLFQSYRPQGLVLADEKLRVDPEYRVVAFDYGAITLNYNRELLKAPPTTWEELLDPSLRKKIVVMNPATSSPGRNFLLFTLEVFGEPGYLDFWKRLKPNLLTVTGGWSEGYGLYSQGEAPIVLSYETSPAYHILFEKVTKYDNLIFNDQAYAQVEVAGIVKKARNLKNARRGMDYLVSLDFQKEIPMTQIMYPIHPEAPLPEAFKQVKRAGKLVALDESRVAQNFDRWLKEWEAVMR